MILFILLCAYIGILVLLVHRLKQIRKYPKKFDSVPGYEQYCKSIWYWPAYREYGKSAPPDNCALPAMGLLWVAMIFWLFISEYLYRMFTARVGGGEYHFTVGWFYLIGGCFFILYSYAMASYLTMFSKRPAAICYNIHGIFRKERRSVAWEKMTKLIIILTVSLMPIRILLMDNYGYVNSEKLVYDPLLSFNEQVFEFDSIDRIEVIYDETESTVKHCYIYNARGEKYDLKAPYMCVDNKAFELFDYVAEHLPAEQQSELQHLTELIS